MEAEAMAVAATAGAAAAGWAEEVTEEATDWEEVEKVVDSVMEEEAKAVKAAATEAESSDRRCQAQSCPARCR
jgi:hypothetical protein